MTQKVIGEVRIRIREFQKIAFKNLKLGNFKEIASETYKIVTYVKEVEREHKAHLAMTVHMLDSLGLTALHADKDQRQSNGCTDELTRQFLSIQIFPLQTCLPTDGKAQALHSLGVGVIVNDVPDIPFEKEWESQQN